MTPTQTRPDRLIEESRRAAEVFALGAMLEGIALSANTALLATGQPANATQIIGSVLALPISVMMSKRWKRRSAWYSVTDDWHLRLDEAPPVIPFPAVWRWLRGER